MTDAITLSVTAVFSQLPGGAIFSGRTEDGNMCRAVVLGSGFKPLEGETWELTGEWRDSDTYGPQLHCLANACRRTVPRGALIVPWLQRFPGIGRERAERILCRFRGDLDQAFGGATPIEELAEIIAPDRPNLAARLTAAILTEWAAVRSEYEAVCWLEEQGLDDPNIAIKIARLLGPDAVDVLGRNPYVLAAVLPWRRVDAVGKRILSRQARIANPKECAERIVGAIDVVLQDRVGEGHTAMSRADLPDAVSTKAGIALDGDFAERVERLGILNRAIATTDRNDTVFRAPGCALMEDELEARFQRMVCGEEQGRLTVPSRGNLRQMLSRIEASGRPLHPEQREAVLTLVQRPLACLIGGAGTGKTTTLQAFVRLFEAMGGRVEIAALAGKAALRASQSTGHRAWTIHRLLEGLERRRNAEAENLDVDSNLPLLDDRTLLVVDEASMVDLGQWHALMGSMPPGCRLLMCGDPMQLPPIGFGVVFHRLATMDTVAARLETIHRQSGASGIPKVADAIRNGSAPAFQPYEGLGAGVNFRTIGAGEDLGDVVAQIAADLGGFVAGEYTLQIIAPLNEQGDGSVSSLNRRFHGMRLQASSLDPEVDVVKGFLGQYFAIGDPVTHLTNDYSRGLWNGSLGHVISINPHAQIVTVAFGGERYEFGKKDLINLGLAYAVTCHRAQGSSARRVIIPIVETRLLDPSWVYTAVTRAEEQAVLVGDPATLARALRRLPAWRTRVTGCDFSKVGEPLGRADCAA